jgi:4-alpha-glucanotransferase
MKQTWWQVLPLSPTGYGDSPYQSYSAFAGNIFLLSPEVLREQGLLDESLFASQEFNPARVDFERIAPLKWAMVRAAWDRASRHRDFATPFEAFCQREQHWLHDFALFMAIREALGQCPLSDWPDDVRRRQPTALAALEQQLNKEIQLHKYGQYLFEQQWSALRGYANSRGVRLLGDAPIFVAGDSADVWANPNEFLLDDHGHPTAVAGVPPDYFNSDGQLWGNPLYNWQAMQQNGYAWWLARLEQNLKQVDLIRLDHFRGFAAAWHVPRGADTAKHGEWVPGAGADLFHTLRQRWPELPFVAEDLGYITADVHALRKQYNLPGMYVLQFMLGEPDNPYWPHNYDSNGVVYTGTHDNDTTQSWFSQLGETDKAKLTEYLGHPADNHPAWLLTRMAWQSVANIAIAPLQDLLGLGGDARMNTPGNPHGNWYWRLRPEQFHGELIDKLAALTELSNRVIKANGSA